MPPSKRPDHFVVDGSNIATEGRSRPSLEQLNDAVLAFKKQHPEVAISVVVDATFGHRIAKGEVKAFDEAIANNELVAPPAGAVGRGDAFVLAIADQSGAGVLSNDSFQEFHGEYPWLFDNGRLVGGKPVPNVGWIFVERSPVRGPKSRQSIREAKNDPTADRQAAKKKAASRVRKKSADDKQATTKSDTGAPSGSTTGGSTASGAASSGGGSSRGSNFVNDQLEFIEFVAEHPIGSRLSATVASYASHGAYASVGAIEVYIPLRYMAEPAPRSAKQVLELGASVEVVVVGFTPDRRSIDAALVAVAAAALEQEGHDSALLDAEPPAKPTRKRAAEKSTAKKSSARKAAAKKSTAKKSTAKASTVAANEAESTAEEPVSHDQTAEVTQETTSTKRATRKRAAKTSTTKKSTAKKSTAKKAAVKKSSAATARADKAAAKKSTAKKATAKTPKKMSAAKTSTAKETAAAKPAASASKIRVRELAKELGRSNAEVVSICEQLGLGAKTHASSLTADHAALVRTAAGATE